MVKKQADIVIDPKISELELKYARSLADYSNLEKRYARESSSVVKFANFNILEKILEIRDHLEMASATMSDPSLKMILGSLDKLLADEDVIEVKFDSGFNPETMECHEQVPGVEGAIVSVIRKGYTLHDRTLRLARVTVGHGQSDLNKVN